MLSTNFCFNTLMTGSLLFWLNLKMYISNLSSLFFCTKFQNSSSLWSSTRVNHQSLTFVTEDSPNISSTDFCFDNSMTGSLLFWFNFEVRASTAANLAEEARESALLKFAAELGGVTSSAKKIISWAKTWKWVYWTGYFFYYYFRTMWIVLFLSINE